MIGGPLFLGLVDWLLWRFAPVDYVGWWGFSIVSLAHAFRVASAVCINLILFSLQLINLSLKYFYASLHSPSTDDVFLKWLLLNRIVREKLV
jgi:hypothetical protein